MKEKQENSVCFADTYDDAKVFIDYCNEEEIKIDGTYLEMWNYVQKGMNSLKCGLNFWIYIVNWKENDG